MADFYDEGGALDDSVVISDDSPKLTGSDAEDEHIASFDNEQYGRRVAKRISKLVYEREVEHTERLKLQQQLEQTQAQLKAFEDKLNGLTQSNAVSEIEAKRSELKELRKIALAADDLDEMNRIDDELLDLRFKEREEKQKQQPNTPNQQQVDDRTGQQQQPPQQFTQAALEWAQRNAAWVNHPDYEKQYQAANKLYQRMVDEEFFDANDPETFAELDRRLERFRSRPASNDGGINRGMSGDQMPGQATVGLTSHDRQRMAAFNLDPDNPAHRAAWVAEKKRSRKGGF